MTPQERELLTNLVDRLRQAPQQQRDAEAESMINALVQEKPETPYLLAQTVLIQDFALHQAQARIADLEKQAQPPQQAGGGFLSAVFGSGRPAQGAPPAQGQSGYAQPQAGPWGPAPTAVAPAAAPVFAQAPSGQPSFLRNAATTAAGVAGGALLFQGIESLLGGHSGMGGFGGAAYGGMMQPGLTETVVNNYYGDSAPDTQQADYGGGGGGVGGDSGYQDASYDDSSFDTGGDFGGGDFGSDV